MNHRKRHQMQHKFELTTLLKIVLAKKSKKQVMELQNTQVNVATQLATEAIALSKICDAALVTAHKPGRTVVASSKAVY